MHVDVVILGSGFGGSLLSMILRRIGLQVALIERHGHPRFAIGESSTPTADLILADLCDRYDLTTIKPLAHYGPWRQTHPQLGCGLKRGFSYFFHEPGVEYSSDEQHSRELLVAASACDELGDTHWLRSDVDAYLVRQAIDCGVRYLDHTEVQLRHHQPGWSVDCRRQEDQQTSTIIRSDFLIDATGSAQWLPKFLELPDDTGSLHTHSSSIFAHFQGVPLWSDVLTERGIPQDDYPFPCDKSAQHHLLEEGWMWQLRFDDGRASVGLMLDDEEGEWDQIVRRYPSLHRQLTADAVRLIEPLRKTPRLQRKLGQAAGEDWALLPNSYGFIDALHSTGIAHTIYSLERLGQIFAGGASASQLADFSRDLERDLLLIDRLVHGCYLARRDFSTLVDFSMLYFAGATMFERERIAGGRPTFLCSGNVDYFELVKEAHSRLIPSVHSLNSAEFSAWLRERMQPFNYVGLMDPGVRNMYHHTAAPF